MAISDFQITHRQTLITIVSTIRFIPLGQLKALVESMQGTVLTDEAAEELSWLHGPDVTAPVHLEQFQQCMKVRFRKVYATACP